MSKINEIYDFIAAWDLYWDSDVPVGVEEIHSLEEGVDTPKAPIRILSPFDPDTSQTSGHVALDNTMIATWNISDVLYIRPTAHGGNIGRAAPQVINYMKNYIARIKADRSPTTESWIESIDWDFGTYEYAGSEPYYGVKVTLEIHEVI